MSFKYILFDLDGTLTDPKEGITKSVQHALRAFGIDEPDLDQLVSFIGPPLIESFRDFYDFTPEQALEGVAKYREYFCDRGIFENKVIPGIPSLLQNLKENGKILCLATSKPEPFARKILEHFDLMQWFDETVGASLDESRGTKTQTLAFFRQMWLRSSVAEVMKFMFGLCRLQNLCLFMKVQRKKDGQNI